MEVRSDLVSVVDALDWLWYPWPSTEVVMKPACIDEDSILELKKSF